jgi:hypothetical protein
MSPPATATTSGPSVSIPLTEQELKSFAVLVLANVDLDPMRFGLHRINRMAVRFLRRMPRGTFWQFFLYLSDHILKLTEALRVRALQNPDIYQTNCWMNAAR